MGCTGGVHSVMHHRSHALDRLRLKAGIWHLARAKPFCFVAMLQVNFGARRSHLRGEIHGGKAAGG